MADYEGISCKIYLVADIKPKEFGMTIAEIVGASYKLGSIEIGSLSIDTTYDKFGRFDSDDFVEWPFFIDVYAANEAIARETYISAVRKILSDLRANGFRAVPACDFEDELK